MRDQLSWLEHLPYKQGVGGSNPSFRTTLRSWFHMPTQIKQFLRCRYPQILGVGQKGEAQARWTRAGYGDTKCRCSITASTTACQAVSMGSIPITCSRVVRKNQVRTRCDVRSQYHLRNKNEAIVTADTTPGDHKLYGAAHFSVVRLSRRNFKLQLQLVQYSSSVASDRRKCLG